MVPDKFNMVDMGGIDIILMQGEEVEGLYDKLVESIAQCRYQCLYNWYFDDVLIPPTYVSMSIEEDSVIINSGITVDSNNIIHVYSLEIPSVIDSLSVTENGDYEVPQGVDGFNPVSVNVQPVLESLSVTENGTYTPESPVQGFSSVSVDVPDVVFLSGTSPPSSSIGEDGDIYLLLVNPDYEYDASLGWSCLKEYYVNSTEQKLSTHSSAFYKTVEGGCIAVEWGPSAASNGFYGPVLLSTVADYVKYTVNTSVGGSVDIDGVTWYYSTGNSWTRTRDSNATIPSFVSSTHNKVTDIPSILQAAHYSPGPQGSATIVSEAFIKVSGAWQNLIGSNINDILQEG